MSRSEHLRGFAQAQARLQREIAAARRQLDDAGLRGFTLAELKDFARRKRRPGEGSMPAVVEPPRGPRPRSGGAVAPLEFDEN